MKFYNGNLNLKRSGEPVRFTKKQVEEYIKCKEDVLYFAENYMKIINLDKGLINIPLYDYQKKFLKTLKENRFVAAIQARQSGKCVCINSNITIRNKKTGERKTITIGELYDQTKLSKEAQM